MSETVIRQVAVNGVTLAIREWGMPGLPTLVLLPGTGLAAAIFAEAEALLAGGWHGYTVDRRGQGLSEKPATGYEFGDFADDLVELGSVLGFKDAYGIGHSAGGTDLLLAAAREPARWSRIAVIEPTMQDPRTPPLPETDPPSWHESYQRMMRRRPGYDSLELAVERFRTNPGFARCPEERVRAYLETALDPSDDGLWRLRCTREVESQMNRSILQVMQNRYKGSQVFAPILSMRTPTTVVTTEHSGDIYGDMAQRVLDAIPGAVHLHKTGLGHIVPLESPETIAELAESFRVAG